MKAFDYICDGQMSIFDIFGDLSDSKPFCWDEDVNCIYQKILDVAEKFKLEIGKAEWEIWSHVPNLGYRMWMTLKVTKEITQNLQFTEEIENIVDFAKERKIELSPLYSACFFYQGQDTASFPLSTMFLDDRKRRKK